MAAPKRDRLMLARDRERLCELLNEGYTPTQIWRKINEGRSEELQISREAIYNDIKVMEGEWLESGVQNFNAWRMRIVDSLLHLKSFLWQEMKSSKEPKLKVETEAIVDDDEYDELKEEGTGMLSGNPRVENIFHRKAKITEEMRNANPAYAAQIAAIDMHIADLLHLKGANKISFTDPSGQHESNPGEYVKALMEEMSKNNQQSPLTDGTPQRALPEPAFIEGELIEDDRIRNG